MRPRLVIGLHPAGRAKQMLGSTRAKAVAGHCFALGKQFESRVRDNQVEITSAAAHRAVAVEQLDLGRWQREAEADSAAMALASDSVNHESNHNALLAGSRTGGWAAMRGSVVRV